MPETLRKDRKDYSKPVMDKKLKRNKSLLKLQENEVIFRWKGKRHVYAISNAHADKIKQFIHRHEKEPVRPVNVVTDYNWGHVRNRSIRPTL